MIKVTTEVNEQIKPFQCKAKPKKRFATRDTNMNQLAQFTRYIRATQKCILCDETAA